MNSHPIWSSSCARNVCKIASYYLTRVSAVLTNFNRNETKLRSFGCVRRWTTRDNMLIISIFHFQVITTLSPDSLTQWPQTVYYLFLFRVGCDTLELNPHAIQTTHRFIVPHTCNTPRVFFITHIWGSGAFISQSGARGYQFISHFALLRRFPPALVGATTPSIRKLI